MESQMRRKNFAKMRNFNCTPSKRYSLKVERQVMSSKSSMSHLQMTASRSAILQEPLETPRE